MYNMCRAVPEKVICRKNVDEKSCNASYGTAKLNLEPA
jgi:hypothetical protein